MLCSMCSDCKCCSLLKLAGSLENTRAVRQSRRTSSADAVRRLPITSSSVRLDSEPKLVGSEVCEVESLVQDRIQSMRGGARAD